MASLTGKTPASTYKDLLQVSNTNSGIDATKRFVEDGEGTVSTLQLSTTKVNINSGFQIAGVDVTATAGDLNSTLAPYVELFNNTTDWGAAAGGAYTITVLAATHGFGTSVSNIAVYEIVAGVSTVNILENSINASGDVSISVTETPDNRFTGKVIIT